MFSFKKYVAGINAGADIESAMTIAASTISLDQFIDDNVVGSSFKDLMNKDTFMSLYSMNKHGIGTREPASYFMDSLTTFFNPLLKLILQTEFQIARQKASTSTEQLVSDMFNTPIDGRDVEELKADYPNQYADLEKAYSNITQPTN